MLARLPPDLATAPTISPLGFSISAWPMKHSLASLPRPLPHDRGFVSGLPRSKGRASVRDRLITGQEDSPPWSCRRRCTPFFVDLQLDGQSGPAPVSWSVERLGSADLI
jgi:hypothetical protein